MTIKKPEPYGWTIEGTPLIWRGENAIEDAKSYARNWKDDPEPIPLYREPPAQPKQASVTCNHEWFRTGAMAHDVSRCIHCGTWNKTPAPTPPKVKAPADFVGLTYDEIVALTTETWGCASIAPQKAVSFAYALGGKLKEKNQ